MTHITQISENLKERLPYVAYKNKHTLEKEPLKMTVTQYQILYIVFLPIPT